MSDYGGNDKWMDNNRAANKKSLGFILLVTNEE